MLRAKTEIKDITKYTDIIISNINAAVLVINKNFEVVFHNQSFAKNISTYLLGEEVAKFVHCTYELSDVNQCGNLFHCNLCEIRKTVNEVFSTNEPFKDGVFNTKVKQGSIELYRTYAFSVHPVCFANEGMTMVIIEDITDKKQQKEILESQNKNLQAVNEQKNKFLSIASHDLRNPIAAIQACSNLLISSLDGQLDEDQRNLLEIIFTKSQYSLHLISDLLDYSKIEAGKLNLYLHPENFNDFIKYIYHNYLILARQNKIKIELNIPEKLPVIPVDRNRIEQVINNLIDNAIKYSLPGEKVVVTCSSDEDYLKITVADEGPGIPQEELAHIFNAFHKVESSFHSKRNGSGLGLAIVKKIIDAHNGEVEVESVFEQGSEFSIKLPVCQ